MIEFNRKVEVTPPPQDRPKACPPKDATARTVSNSSKATSYVNVAKNSINNCGNDSRSVHDASGISTPTIILSQDIPNDFPLALLGCYKDFRSIANTRTMCSTEGFLEVDFKYLGGLWVLFDFTTKDARDKFLNHKGVKSWFSTLKLWHNDFVMEERLIWLEIEGVPIRAWNNDTFTQICRKWGEVLFMDDSDSCNRLSKRLCVKSSHALLVFASTLVTINNVTYAIRVRELCSWTPTFIGADHDSDEASSIGAHEEQEDQLFEENDVEPNVEIKDDTGTGPDDPNGQDQDTDVKVDVPTHVPDGLNNSPVDSDPFGLGPLINKKSTKGPNVCYSDTPEYPPGYSPFNDDQQSSDSIHKLSGGESITQPGFSLLERLEETIKVGLALGLNMEGCEKTLASLIADKGDTWNNDGIVNANGMVLFKEKLQNLKKVIREWVGANKSASYAKKKDHQTRLSSIDVKIDQGVGVTDEEVSHMANIIGCGAANFPLKYLGVPVGCNMVRCYNWNAILQKFSSKLCSWKARLLSVGGRLSSIKSVLGNLPTYYMSIYLMPVSIRKKLESMRNKFFIGGDPDDKKITWVKWDRCLASKKDGGLGIGSIFGLNIGLLFKWIWRFLNNHSDLWVRVIQGIHGVEGGINVTNNSLKRSTWGSLLSSINSLKQKGIDLISLCSHKIGNGADSRFWEDTWCGDQPLKVVFPRIYLLDTDKSCSIASRVCLHDWSSVLRRNIRGGVESFQFSALKDAIENISLTDQRDSWQWALDTSVGFSVASLSLSDKS
ncbi:RNA-directed DNA polymerase, eukaryota, Reverse transcriptase zinc-binding domain protein [Artemisia annua]|uniref:RNA-directed DNA polymerase, eukaryota, Reverse transcriptase zinc-binding domain protein n=1 Tax=Artemisia annua TaxID=35608 RepID=A0A2U1Q2B8_ARTAN|nr:RNA-directed DNA polymerase, eukaryota, Reverse transcriptase zinc-binding domain protein [Artemisia annua]